MQIKNNPMTRNMITDVAPLYWGELSQGTVEKRNRRGLLDV